MFGALNRFISRLDAEREPSSTSLYPSSGFQILRNKNADISLEPWYDFIIGINGRNITVPDPYLFAKEVQNCAGSEVALTYFSARGNQIYTLHIHVPAPSPTLGLTLQWNQLALADQVWHILSVSPDSPADSAGLLNHADYIVGTPEGQIHGEAGLSELVEEFISRELRIWVYNHEFDVTRLVTITPSKSWGGEGALGCILGYGALHRIPTPLTQGPPEGPGEALFSHDSERHEIDSLSTNPNITEPLRDSPQAQLLVPADLPMSSTVPGGASAVRSSNNGVKGARRSKRPISPGAGFDAVFQEGADRSLNEEVTQTTKDTQLSPPPPPPPPQSLSTAQEGHNQGDKSAEILKE